MKRFTKRVNLVEKDLGVPAHHRYVTVADIFPNGGEDGPILFPTDRIEIVVEEPYDYGNVAYDGSVTLVVSREVDYTDEEQAQAEAELAQRKVQSRQERYEEYLRLREEFDGVEVLPLGSTDAIMTQAEIGRELVSCGFGDWNKPGEVGPKEYEAYGDGKLSMVHVAEDGKVKMVTGDTEPVTLWEGYPEDDEQLIELAEGFGHRASC